MTDHGRKVGVRVARNPWGCVVLADAGVQMQRYAARFALTPADRTHLVVGEAKRDTGADYITG